MPARTLPGIGLTGFWDLGFNGWKDAHDLNLLVLSVIAGGQVLSKLAALPGSPTNGDVHLLDETAGADANKLCIRDAGAWVKIVPKTGAILYDVAGGVHRWFNGTVWAVFSGGGAATSPWKSPVRAASTANVTLATGVENGDTLDGVTLATGNRILLKNQAAGAENGIYVVAASGAPARASDAASGADLVNATVFVSEGTTLADTQWTCSTDAPITPDTTALTFVQIAAGTTPLASIAEVLSGTDSAKAVTPDALAALWEQGVDVASAGTVSLGEGGYFNITGTAAITDIDFATDKAGRKAWVKFAGILTLTNGANLILPTGANITTAAGDSACFVSEGADVVRCIAYQRASGAALVSGYSGGKQTIPLLASAMTPRTSNGAAEGTSESATNKVMRRTLDFDAATAEYAQIVLPMPKSWNEGTVTAQFVWEAPGGTGDVVWAIQCLCLSDDDVIDTAFGTAISVTDGVTAITDVMISAETGAVTASNSPAEGDLLLVQVYRDAANGSDTLASDAKLIAVKLFITTNAATDA